MIGYKFSSGSEIPLRIIPLDLAGAGGTSGASLPDVNPDGEIVLLRDYDGPFRNRIPGQAHPVLLRHPAKPDPRSS